jgi:hypothetical protein
MTLDPRKLCGAKTDALKELLRAENSVFVHVDTRLDGVNLPKPLLGRPQVALQLGYNMTVPVRDLTMDQHEWSATLSFDRTPFFCTIPWAAVYLIVGDSGRGASWPDDIPFEARVQREDGQRGYPRPRFKNPEEAPPPAKRQLPANWRVFDGGLSSVPKDVPEGRERGPHSD